VPNHDAAGTQGARRRDRHGIEIRESSYTIANLWPGQWTVRLFDRSGDHVLATGKATIVATETVTCDLAVP